LARKGDAHDTLAAFAIFSRSIDLSKPRTPAENQETKSGLRNELGWFSDVNSGFRFNSDFMSVLFGTTGESRP
jgi:hypothetical protein